MGNTRSVSAYCSNKDDYTYRYQECVVYHTIIETARLSPCSINIRKSTPSPYTFGDFLLSSNDLMTVNEDRVYHINESGAMSHSSL